MWRFRLHEYNNDLLKLLFIPLVFEFSVSSCYIPLCSIWPKIIIFQIISGQQFPKPKMSGTKGEVMKAGYTQKDKNINSGCMVCIRHTFKNLNCEFDADKKHMIEISRWLDLSIFENVWLSCSRWSIPLCLYQFMVHLPILLRKKRELSRIMVSYPHNDFRYSCIPTIRRIAWPHVTLNFKVNFVTAYLWI